jgi:hypothetical protein
MDAYHFFKDFAGPIATIVAAAAAVFVTWTLGKAQYRIAEDRQNSPAAGGFGHRTALKWFIR